MINIKIVSLLRLLNSFTGKPLLSSEARIRCSDGFEVVSKGEGIFAIVNKGNKAGELLISIEGTCFKALTFTPLETDGKSIENIWMNPNKNYPFPEDTGFIDLETFDENAFAVNLNAKSAFTVIKEVKKKNKVLSLYTNFSKEAEGRKMFISSLKEKDKGEAVEIEKFDAETGEAFLKDEIKNAYESKKTFVYPVFEAFKSEKDSGTIAVPKVSDKTECLIFKDGKITVKEINRGKRIKL